MARYCFYCGRELEDQEKCDCRSQTGQASTRYGHFTGNSAPPPNQSKAKEAGRSSGSPASGSQGNWQHRETPPPPKGPRRQDASGYAYRRQPAAGRGQGMLSLMQFFATPADTMNRQLSADWQRSHSLWLIAAVILSGIHYLFMNRALTALLTGVNPKLTAWDSLLSFLIGIGLVFLILLLYTLALWLLARFLYRQGGLPFIHALAAGKMAWQYLTLFLLLALPSLFTGGALYGLALVLMGLVFSVIVHTRQLARLTRLDENRTWQLAWLSIILFAGILSTVATLVRLFKLLP